MIRCPQLLTIYRLSIPIVIPLFPRLHHTNKRCNGAEISVRNITKPPKIYLLKNVYNSRVMEASPKLEF